MFHNLCSKDLEMLLRLQGNGCNLAIKTISNIQGHGVGCPKFNNNDLYYFLTSLLIDSRMFGESIKTVSSLGYKIFEDKSFAI